MFSVEEGRGSPRSKGMLVGRVGVGASCGVGFALGSPIRKSGRGRGAGTVGIRVPGGKCRRRKRARESENK